MKEDFRVRSLGLLPFPKQISYCEINLTTSFCISIYCLFPSLVNCCFVGASSRLWSSYQFCFLEPRYPPLPEFPWYRGKSSRTELFFQLSYFEFLIFIADTSVWTQLIHLQEGFLNFLCLCWPNHGIYLEWWGPLRIQIVWTAVVLFFYYSNSRSNASENALCTVHSRL